MFDPSNKKKESLNLVRVVSLLFYIIPAYFIFLFFLITRNYFPNIKDYGNLHFILVIVLLFCLIALIFLLFKAEEKKKFVHFYLYSVFFLIVEIVVQSTGGINSILYPLLYLLILVYMAISPLKISVFFLTATILAETFMLLGQKDLKDHVFKFNTHIFFYLVFFTVFYLTLMYEKKQKDKYRLLLKTYEGLKDEEGVDKENKNLDITVLSEQGRKKHDISVSHKLNDKIFEILQKLKDIMHPFTVMYLEIDETEKSFFIKEVISESDHINYNLEVDVDAGYPGWVAKNKRTLSVSNFESAISDSFYYTGDEMIKSLMMVPATDRRDKVRGVLLADSRDVQYFTSKEENLMYLVAYQILQEIHNYQIMRKIEYNAKESAILNLVSKRLNVSLDLTDTIRVTLTTIGDLIRCNLVAAIFINDEETLGKINAVHGEEYEHLAGRTFKITEGIFDYVTKKRKRVLFRDFTSVADKKNIFDDSMKLKDISTIFALPLISNDIAFGAVLIASRVPLQLSSYTVNTIETLVNQSAISIANARMYLKVEMLATTDGLTGLYNHKCFQDKITEEMDRLHRYPENISVLLMDIDHFKRFNDTYGHPIGDKVLKTVADIFAGSLRKVDFAARYGGEEFVAILVNTDKKGAQKMGERIRKNIERKKMMIADNELHITVSIGIATYPEDSKDKKGLINLADRSLYYAKETGRNRCVHYEDIPKDELI